MPAQRSLCGQRAAAVFRPLAAVCTLLPLIASASLADGAAKTVSERQVEKQARNYSFAVAQLVKEHRGCLTSSARALVLLSAEPELTIAREAMAACYDYRDKFAALGKKYGLLPRTVEEWEAEEAQLLRFVIFEVIKQRGRWRWGASRLAGLDAAMCEAPNAALAGVHDFEPLVRRPMRSIF